MTTANTRNELEALANAGDPDAQETLARITGDDMAIPATAAERPRNVTRDETIAIIRAALKRRSGRAWSVKGGRGTAYGWIRIDAEPKRCTWGHRPRPGMGECPPPGNQYWEEHDTGKRGGHMSPEDRAALGRLLGMAEPVHHQGVNVAASSDYYREYIDRAEGRTPSKIAEPYWD